MARHYGLTYFDIGSRGGFQDDLHPFAFAEDVVGFEPDPAEFKRLQSRPSEPWKPVIYLPQGGSVQTRRQILYMPTDPQSASLLKNNAMTGVKFCKPKFFEIDRTEEIEIPCLNDPLRKRHLHQVTI